MECKLLPADSLAIASTPPPHPRKSKCIYSGQVESDPLKDAPNVWRLAGPVGLRWGRGFFEGGPRLKHNSVLIIF